jgi:hypothetical protein
MKNKGILWPFIILALLISGCAGTQLIKSSMNTGMLKTLKSNRNSIKIHVNDGGLFVLNNWSTNPKSDTIKGFGEYYNYQRDLVNSKEYNPSAEIIRADRFQVPSDKITLIEANTIAANLGNLAAITIVGVPMSIFTIYCITNPKACFGSCPTFYALENGSWNMMAEGFSSSIAPTFEKKDIDMLCWADVPEDTFSLKLTNEALETHVIRYVDLLAFPESGGDKVFVTESGSFYRTSEIISPSSCMAEEGDCLDLIKDMDRKERFCGTDPKNLAKKEEIILSFDTNSNRELGLLIGSKQTLLTTHLFYQVMAYTGKHYGSMVAEVENGNTFLKNRIQKLWDKLGGIEIFIQDKNKNWKKVDEINEMGPIASDVHLVKLPSGIQEEITIKLRMTKGLWRIDYLALANIIGEESPVRIKPTLVLKGDSVDAEALKRLSEDVNPLITLPGDKYELKYKLPNDCSFQFFIETKGYYIEWMREEWLAEENLRKAAFAFQFPGLFMRKAAPEFKKAEPLMEKIFWESRYVRE